MELETHYGAKGGGGAGAEKDGVQGGEHPPLALEQAEGAEDEDRVCA